MTMLRLMVAGLTLSLLVGCSELATRGVVTATDLGAAWPFTVETGKLACDGGAVTFTTDGRTYALNEAAREQQDARGWLDPHALLAAGPGVAAVESKLDKNRLEPLIKRAGSLCGLPLVPGGAADPHDLSKSGPG